MGKSIKLNITRPNGGIEEIEVLEKFKFMNQERFNMIKTQTEKAGRGIVNHATIIVVKNNIPELIKRYNNLHNEGGEGYIPDTEEYWISQPDYKEYEETVIIK
jgi:hypothetical protein